MPESREEKKPPGSNWKSCKRSLHLSQNKSKPFTFHVRLQCHLFYINASLCAFTQPQTSQHPLTECSLHHQDARTQAGFLLGLPKPAPTELVPAWEPSCLSARAGSFPAWLPREGAGSTGWVCQQCGAGQQRCMKFRQQCDSSPRLT